MAIAELVMPKLGESIMEATILKWHKKVGDYVKFDETVLDIATDKVDSEVPSTEQGILTEILFQVNDVVPIGAVIARIQTSTESKTVEQPDKIFSPIVDPPESISTPVFFEPAPLPIQEVPIPLEENIPYTPSPTLQEVSKPIGNRFYSPLVLNIANSEGISLSELERIPGTGNDGRVSKRDVLQYVADKKAGLVTNLQQPIQTVPASIAAPIISAIPTQPINIPTEVPVQETTISIQAPVEQTVVPLEPEPVEEINIPIEHNNVSIEAAPIEEKNSSFETPVQDTFIPTEVPFSSPAPVEVASVVENISLQKEPEYIPEVNYPDESIQNRETKYIPPIHQTEVPKQIQETPKQVPTISEQKLQEPFMDFGKTEIRQPISSTGKFSDPASVILTGNTEIIEMDRMRKLIAKHMVDSKHTSPHVTSFTEADVTNMVQWREKVKVEFERREGTKLTFTPMFIECIANVIKNFPLVNCSVEGDNIIIKKDINIGMATALPSGNLIVPVIKAADQLNIVGLSKAVNGLADSARNNRLKPEDTSGGTFTLTNVGTFGSLMGTPIIPQPQVAILAVGAIKKRPMVIETTEGDKIGIRHMMYLSLSYDHRIVDGSIGASFLTAVAKAFENWDPNKQWFHYL